ncbi:creatininase family protein [Natrinema sp. DC36]|uniref:creatininase family protein n=1 Tax=Natrinema sp. DC36 TaxID=2878680 RepID=UPI001CF0637C|nr:creatininase family protein [Natrinema sp. DC36]
MYVHFVFHNGGQISLEEVPFFESTDNGFGTCSWTGVEDVTPTVALLPVRSTEHHEPHASVGTDTIITRPMAAEVDRRSDFDSIVLPTLPVDIATYHGHFPETLSVSAETL